MPQDPSRREIITAAIGAAASGAQTDEPAKLGIVGVGLRSRAHFDALRQVGEARVTALCDLDPARMAKANEALPEKAAMYVDYRELVRDRNVCAVVIVTPGYLHKDMALEALRAGKDVLLEKPLALNYADAAGIAAEAKRLGRIVSVGMQRHFGRTEDRVRKAVRSGAIGRVRLVTCSENRGDWNAASWRYTDPATGKQTSWRNLAKTCGSSELEFSIHAFGLITSVVNAPLVRVAATGGVLHYADGRDTRDASSVIAEFANGVRLNYSFCCFAPGGGSPLTILGDSGVIRREGESLTIARGRGKPEPLTVESDLPEDGPEVLMYRDFLAAVRTRKPPQLSPERVMEASKLAFAADMSIARHRFVSASEFAA